MFVVFGANGKVGGAAVRALRKNAISVRGVVRNPAAGKALADSGCEAFVGDLQNEEHLRQAIRGADGVLILCPLDPLAVDPMEASDRLIASICRGLKQERPPRIVAISDYGADRDVDTGVTLIFKNFETQLRTIDVPVVLLRSAEHMQNLARIIPTVLSKKLLPSFHHPVTKLYPTVSAFDVGEIAAELLIDTTSDQGVRVVHVEGPSRYTSREVAATLGDLVGEPIQVVELPREAWLDSLSSGRMGRRYAELIARTFDAHNSDYIDVEEGGEIRKGKTSLREALAVMLPRGDRPNGY
jgi:NAD(P)H dehydrogenase (quinone)